MSLFSSDVAVALDLTPEQVQETLKYFTLSSDRTNQMTKTHNDLDAILQLLQEKEKDLELAAKIGQSLLERNKNLMQKTEVMEKYLGEHTDREEQLRHDIVRKNDLLQKFLKDQEDFMLEVDNKSEEEAKSCDSLSFGRNDSFGTLQDKCHDLEQQNTRFILEALQMKEQTASEEQKERQLVSDCVHQLIEAKDQITELTDDIGQKAEDNLRQQEEISQLITTVIDLQKRHSQLSTDNEELQGLLCTSQAGQDELKQQVADLQDKYHECFEILMENQQEMKSLNQKIETPRPKTQSTPIAAQGARDSIALEIEQTVKRDLESIKEKRQNLARVLQTVRNINISKGKKPKKGSRQAGSSTPDGTGFKFSPVSSGLPRSPSDASIDGTEDGSSATGLDPRYSYSRRSFRKPEKLQIVKPIKGSVTLQQWKKLALPTMKLEEQRPGVHVKGDLQSTRQQAKVEREFSDTDDYEEDEPIQIRMKAQGVSPVVRDDQGSPQPPRSLALASLVHEKGIEAGSRRESTSSILAQLLNSPSATTTGKSSVGQVLADVLQKASNEASTKEPRRAESLRNLANYFSEKEKSVQNYTESIAEDESPPVSPPYNPPVLPGTASGGILSRILVSTGLNVNIPTPRPIATVAGSVSTPTTSTAAGLLSHTGFGRTSSGTNLKSLESTGSPQKRLSLEASSLMAIGAQQGSYNTGISAASLPTLRRRASSGDLESMNSSTDSTAGLDTVGFGNRLYRSNSSGSLTNLSQLNTETPSPSFNSGGFFGRLTRRPSLGSLTDLVQRSQIDLKSVPIPPIERASSIDSGLVSRPRNSPPSPSHFDNNSSFFSAQPSTTGTSKGLFSGSRLSSLAGVRGIWSQGPPSRTPEKKQAPSTPTVNKSEERLEKINKAFALEDFGGMGLMSFFGNKKSSQK